MQTENGPNRRQSQSQAYQRGTNGRSSPATKPKEPLPSEQILMNNSDSTTRIVTSIPIPPEKPKPPLIYAERIGDQLRFWCGHCGKYHWHGIGSGHRVSHCWRPNSPYDRVGYVLVTAPEVGD